jgi:hypothetical protein
MLMVRHGIISSEFMFSPFFLHLQLVISLVLAYFVAISQPTDMARVAPTSITHSSKTVGVGWVSEVMLPVVEQLEKDAREEEVVS